MAWILKDHKGKGKLLGNMIWGIKQDGDEAASITKRLLLTESSFILLVPFPLH